MPFYEYECQSCKFYTELLQKVSDPPLEKCPSCGKKSMKKLVSAPVFRLKGGGWYETDFKSDKENKRNLAVEKEPESSSEEKPAKAAPVGDAPSGESKAAESKPVAAKSGGSPASASKSTAAKSVVKSKAKPVSRTAAKSKAKPAARRKSR